MKILPSILIEFILHFITLTNYYNAKKYIQITSIHSTINVETKKNNRVNKMTTLPLIHIDFILRYITLTDYYITKNTFRSQVITEQ